MRAQAELKQIPMRLEYQHRIDARKAASIVGAMKSGLKMPAILVLEDEGNGYVVLDGHHRADAAHQLGLDAISAWVVPTDEYCAVLDAYFGGCSPSRMSDLDDFIMCGENLYCETGAR